MTRTPLFVLAFDHRNSLRRSFLGLADGATPEQSALCLRLKDAVAEALLRAADSGVGGVPGLLTDVEYGAAAARRAGSAGVTVAVPVEASGRRELAWEYEPFSAPLIQVRPAYAKVLVRYNAAGDPAVNARQRAKMLDLQNWCGVHGVGLMVELLVPPVGVATAGYDDELRPDRTVRAVAELVDAGLTPPLWKLEGMPSTAAYAAVALVVRASRDDAGCLVLGRGADSAAVDRWLTMAASVPGFAVGGPCGGNRCDPGSTA
jgi:myo-inositol catabolism protein IolC